MHYKRGKPTTYEVRRIERAYALSMQRESGTGRGEVSPQQIKFATVWLKGVLDELMGPPKNLTRSDIADKSKVHRNRIDDWLKLKAYPQPKTLERFCNNLGIDYAVPATILGWTNGDGPSTQEDPSSAWNKRKRAEALMRALDRRGALTPERRQKYEAIIATAERSYEAGIDQLFEVYERDFAEDPAPGDSPTKIDDHGTSDSRE